MKNEYLSRCGVYCAANACIEQVIQHGEVDVFQAVKTVRRHRPQLVENLVTFLKGIDHEILELDFQFFLFIAVRYFPKGIFPRSTSQVTISQMFNFQKVGCEAPRRRLQTAERYG